MATLGHRQDGAFSVEQLRDLGFDQQRLKRLVAEGRLRRRHRGVYVDALVPLTPRGELRVALFCLGPSAFFSHRTAAALHGLRPLNIHGIEATVVAGHTPHRRGLVVRRTSQLPAPDEIRTRDGLRFSAPARTLLECAAVQTAGELDRTIADAARRRLLNLERVDATLRRHPHHRGVPALGAALIRYRPPVPRGASTLEDEVARWLSTLPEIPPAQRNLQIGPWEIDFYWPDQRLVLEVDGTAYHLTPDETERDRRKDTWLQCRDIRVMRATDFRWTHDRAGIRADLGAMLNRTSPPP